jgi:hypothetical protein
MPEPHDFAVRSDLTKRFGEPCAAHRSIGKAVEAPFVRALAVRSQVRHLPCNCRSAPDTAASTASHRAFRDDREPPLLSGETGGFKPLICPTAKAEYFCEEGWTGFYRFARRVNLSRLLSPRCHCQPLSRANARPM